MSNLDVPNREEEPNVEIAKESEVLPVKRSVKNGAKMLVESRLVNNRRDFEEGTHKELVGVEGRSNPEETAFRKEDFISVILALKNSRDNSELQTALLGDTELDKDFTDLRVLELNFNSRETDLKNALLKKILIRINYHLAKADATPMSEESLLSNFGDIRLIEKQRIFTRRAYLGIKDEKRHEIDEKYHELDEKYIKGEYHTVGEYLEARNVVTKEAVQESGDEELIAMFEDYEKELVRDESIVDVLADPSPPTLEKNEKIVTKKDEIKASTIEISAFGFDLDDVSDSGRIEVNFGDMRQTEMYIIVNEDTGKISFAIKDPSINGGEIRVKSGSDVPPVLDRVHVDGLFTDKVKARFPLEADTYLDDERLLTVMKRLLGSAEDRGFKLSDEKLQIVDKFIQYLSQQSHLQLEDLVNNLLHEIRDDEQGSYFAKKLLAGDV